jgi:hypothetical protein
MAEKRESTVEARAFEVKTGPVDKRGWYVSIEGDDPTGPYSTAIEAGKVARSAILHNAGSLATADATCPGVDNCWLRADQIAGGVMPDRCNRCPDLVPAPRIETGHERRDTDRRQQDDTHFAGSDRRMRDRRTRPVRAVDMQLDRSRGRNKYAVINMREVMAIDPDGGTSTPAVVEVRAAINTLRRHGVLNDGDAGFEGEFFVIMLKDQFADTALLAYAAEARKVGMHAYADDVMQVAMRAGHGSRWCKLPD